MTLTLSKTFVNNNDFKRNWLVSFYEHIGTTDNHGKIDLAFLSFSNHGSYYSDRISISEITYDGLFYRFNIWKKILS
jgi:hypothetical protein